MSFNLIIVDRRWLRPNTPEKLYTAKRVNFEGEIFLLAGRVMPIPLDSHWNYIVQRTDHHITAAHYQSIRKTNSKRFFINIVLISQEKHCINRRADINQLSWIYSYLLTTDHNLYNLNHNY